MEITIDLALHKPLLLPINYNHILQSTIYRLMGDDKCGCVLHDEGYGDNNLNFKMFCFDKLNGKYRVRDRMIEFRDKASFTVRCMDGKLIDNIKNNIKTGIRLGDDIYHYSCTRTADCDLSNCDELTVSMKSPIVSHITPRGEKRARYYNPDELEFYRLIEDNAYKKYISFYGREPARKLHIEPVKVGPKDKLITRFKGGTIIVAWGGRYRLEGPSDMLELVYNAGLGAKNSQGFGMPELI